MIKRILCIDERSEILDLVRDILEEPGQGYEVLLRNTPFQDVAEIEELHPDLILLSIPALPDSLGKQTLTLLSLNPQSVSSPVLVLYNPATGILSQDRNLICGHNFLIPGPWDATDFVESIKRALHGSPSNEGRFQGSPLSST